MAQTALGTLNSLESRLRRLEHYLTCNDGSDPLQNRASTAGTATDRLRKLEGQASKILSANIRANELLQLRDHFPEIFEDWVAIGQEDILHQLHVVLSSAADYSTTVSKLTTLQEYRVTDGKELISLMSLESDLQRFEDVQDSQLLQIHELRQRSATLLAQWYQDHVLDGSAAWSSVEEGMTDIEQSIRRREVAQARERADS